VEFDTSRNSWHVADKCFVGVDGAAVNLDDLYKEFQRFQQEAKPVWKLIFE